jgi:hypothetical protein
MRASIHRFDHAVHAFLVQFVHAWTAANELPRKKSLLANAADLQLLAIGVPPRGIGIRKDIRSVENFPHYLS